LKKNYLHKRVLNFLETLLTYSHSIEPLDFETMSKLDLETFGRTIGIELDRRHNKTKLIKQLQDHIEYMETM